MISVGQAIHRALSYVYMIPPRTPGFVLLCNKNAGLYVEADNCFIKNKYFFSTSGMRKIGLIFSLLLVSFFSSFSSPLRKQIELAVQDSATNSAAVASLIFEAGSSPYYLPSEDIAITPDSSLTNPQLYSYSQDNVALASNSFGTFNNTTILRLGIGLSSRGTYIFSVQQFSNFDPSSMVFLEDRLLGTFTNLRQTPCTVAINQTGEITNRFYLHVTYPPALTSIPAGCTNNDGIISIIEDSSVVWTVCNVYDSTSTLVATDSNLTGNFNFTGLPGGNYRVEFDYNIFSPIQYVLVDEHQLISGMNVSNNHDRTYENIQFLTPGSNATQFQWDFGDGSTITGVANPIYSYMWPGTYTATVNCSNNYGCSGHADTVMYIEVATAIDEIDGNTVKIVTDKNTVMIEMNNALAAHYTYAVYNIEGQEIKSGSLDQTEVSLNFSNDASGMYVVSLRGATSLLSKKVIITK